MRHRTVVGTVLVLLAALIAIGLPGASTGAPRASAAAAPDTLQKVSYQGRTLTVRLRPIALRAPGFEVLVQQANGSYSKVASGPERGYLGTVDGLPSATASAIRTSTGVLEGQIVFDRGAIWQFRGSSVYDTDGTTAPTSYSWPSSTEAARNVTTSPGQAGRTTYRWDIGFDLSSTWYSNATIGSSVAKALDAVELSVVSLLDVYVPNALLRPAVGRVVIRASSARDPYVGNDSPLSTAREEWRDHQADAGVDNVALFNGNPSGGGVAYVSTAGTVWGTSSNGGSGAPRAVLRHELGHNWGAHDNHTNGPEGETINSGNDYERFDGTELSAIFRYRDEKQADSAPFTPLGRFVPSVAPYAALDLVDRLTSGATHSYRPVANDHDANGDALSLTGVRGKSHLGGSVTRSGNVITYKPPAVSKTTTDWVAYTIRDSSGRTATGISLFRVQPATRLAAPSTWAPVTVPTGAVEVRNLQSGYIAGVPRSKKPKGKTVQRVRVGSLTAWKLVPSGSTFRLKSLSGRGCLTPKGAKKGSGVVVRRCSSSALQHWRTVRHPRTGIALYNPARRLCLAPTKGSMNSGARLVVTSCGYRHATAWQVRSIAK